MMNSPASASPTLSASRSLSRTTGYWIATLVLGIEGIIGGILALTRWAPYVEIIGRLGYPTYLMTIIGVWYALAGLIVLAPRLPRAKEWAYAGLFVNYTGAAASHLTVGDGAVALVAPAFFTIVLLASWALRSSSRRLGGPPL
jgi:DoxX-like family